MRKALSILGISHSTFYYKSKRDDSFVEGVILESLEKSPCLSKAALIREIRKTHSWNHKRIERVYSKLVLSGRLIPANGGSIKNGNKGVKIPHVTWTIGMVDETYWDGISVHFFWVMYALGDYPHEVLAMDVDRSFTVRKIIKALKFFVKRKGTPTHIIFWQAKERHHPALKNWCMSNGIRVTFSLGDTPFRKYFIRRYAENVSMTCFPTSMKEGASFIEGWFHQYNSDLP